MENRIVKTELVKWREIQPLQPHNLKLPYNYAHIEESIAKHGFAMPFFVWENKGILFAVDGHTRKEILLQKESVPELLPATFIQAKNKKDAIQILLEVFNQRHNPIDNDVLVEWMEAETVEADDVNVDSLNIHYDKPEKEKEEEENRLGIYPLSVILNAKEYKDFQLYKKENRLKSDTDAFKRLFEAKQLI